LDLVTLRALIEAIVFASPEPVDTTDLAETLGVEPGTMEALIRDIEEALGRADSGITLSRAGGGISMVTKPELSEGISQYLATIRHSALTDASLETLAIIAYRQPITKSEIEQIRGVGAESALITLAQRGLIGERGRKSAPGRPILYGTTKDFLVYLGLSDITSLPGLEIIKDNEDGQRLPGIE
jgi:segregation and condensation protein B